MEDIKDLIFKCRKCEHNLYVSDLKMRTLLHTNCPECGEESGDIWVLVGEGHFADYKY